MNQNVLFLKTDDGRDKQFALLNLSQFCYIEGVEETEQHPDGSKTLVWYHGHTKLISIPYRSVADQIQKSIEASLKMYYGIPEAQRQENLAENRKMLQDFLDASRSGGNM
jgi:hypothetical protein